MIVYGMRNSSNIHTRKLQSQVEVGDLGCYGRVGVKTLRVKTLRELVMSVAKSA